MILRYASMHENSHGHYNLSPSTEFGTETQAEPGQFESQEEAVQVFTGYLQEQSDGAVVTDVTTSEGFAGWGTVLRVECEGETGALYSVSVE